MPAASPPARRRDPGLPAPLYHAVYVALRGWLTEGVYAPGERIPTEPELCRAFRVSRITVRRAVEQLVREGVLSRRQGSGTFVCRQEPGAAAGGLSRRVAGLGASTGIRDLEIAWVAADAETQAALGLDGPGRVHRSRRLRTRGGEAVGDVTIWLPEDVGRQLTRAELRRSTVLEALERAGFAPAEVDERVGAELAGLEASARLGVAAGAPLLRVSRVVRDRGGRPIERVRSLWRADAYEHRLVTRRDRVEGRGWLID